MAPKKRPIRKRVLVSDSIAPAPKEPPMVLVQAALDDLHYIEPLRSRDRLISALNEAFLRIITLERLHLEPAPPKRRRHA